MRASKTFVFGITKFHSGEVVRNPCSNGLLVNKSNKYNYFKGVTVLQKVLNKQLNRNLFMCKKHERKDYIQKFKRYIISFHLLHTLNENTDSEKKHGTG